LFKEPLSGTVPDFSDPKLQFVDFEDRALAIFDSRLFKVMPDKTLIPSRWAMSDIWERSSVIDREDALDIAKVRGFR
jgi:hypothetical protein